MDLFEFLSQQSDGRLIIMGIVTVAVVYYIMQGLVHIFNKEKVDLDDDV